MKMNTLIAALCAFAALAAACTQQKAAPGLGDLAFEGSSTKMGALTAIASGLDKTACLALRDDGKLVAGAVWSDITGKCELALHGCSWGDSDGVGGEVCSWAEDPTATSLSSAGCDANFAIAANPCVDKQNILVKTQSGNPLYICSQPPKKNPATTTVGKGECACVAQQCNADGTVIDKPSCTGKDPATETCDTKDNDCDGSTDEQDAQGCTKFYTDADGDQYGTGTEKCLCAASGLYKATTNTDCDDNASGVHPGATEACNGKDDDCDSQVDEMGASGCTNFYLDADGDTYGTGSSQCLCAADVSNKMTSSVNDDCDDNKSSVNKGAKELCSTKGVDDNCNGSADEPNAEGCTDFYLDADGDGYGTGAPQCLCAANGSVSATKAGDCNDSDGNIHPGATEVCNGVDDNCDGSIDPEQTSGCADYYPDADGDSKGAKTATPKCLCGPTVGFPVKDHTDCDDTNENIHPGATEVCTSKGIGTQFDENCDGQVNENNVCGVCNIAPEVTYSGSGIKTVTQSIDTTGAGNDLKTVNTWVCGDGTYGNAKGAESIFIVSAPNNVLVTVTFAYDKVATPLGSFMMALQSNNMCGPDVQPDTVSADACTAIGSTSLQFLGTGQANQRVVFDGFVTAKNSTGTVKGTATFKFTPQ